MVYPRHARTRRVLGWARRMAAVDRVGISLNAGSHRACCGCALSPQNKITPWS